MSSYILLLFNRRNRRITVGSLGRLEFAPGFYLYVGSGGINVLKRVKRHLAVAKPKHWHIDYLTTGPRRMKPVDAYVFTGVNECRLADSLAKELEPGAVAPQSAVLPSDGRLRFARFGSSDCRCQGHLFHAPGLAELKRALDRTIREYGPRASG